VIQWVNLPHVRSIAEPLEIYEWFAFKIIMWTNHIPNHPIKGVIIGVGLLRYQITTLLSQPTFYFLTCLTNFVLSFLANKSHWKYKSREVDWDSGVLHTLFLWKLTFLDAGKAFDFRLSSPWHDFVWQ